MTELLAAAALLVSVLQASPPRPDLEDLFLSLVEKASQKELDAFRVACTKPDPIFSFESRPKVVEAVKKTAAVGGVMRIRGMVHALGACSDGASALALRGFLGNEILLSRPADLVTALYQEKKAAAYARELVESEPDEFLAVECEAKECRALRKKAFARKREALMRAYLPPDLQPARDLLLQSLKSDR